MPKVEYMKYKVTFNDYIGDYELGETSEGSVDFTGDDIDELVKEVIASDPSFPMVFKQVEEKDIIGLFIEEGEDYPTAVMYTD